MKYPPFPKWPGPSRANFPMRRIYPDDGARREIEFFAFLPVKIDRETRWLERVKVRQQFILTSEGPRWINVEFLP